jgi:hypothetical protein
MGNTLCKPVIQVPQQQIVEQPKNIEPLLTEEAIKILNIENDRNESGTVLEPEPVKEEVVISETKEPEPILTEPVISETKEPVISETVVEPLPVLEQEPIEPVSETIVEPEPEVDQLSIVQPDEASSTSSKEEEVPPLKKKRGRKKKTEQ